MTDNSLISKINLNTLTCILIFCDNNTLKQCTIVSKEFNNLSKEALYYRYINHIKSNRFLLPNSFNFIIEEPSLIPIFDYVQK